MIKLTFAILTIFILNINVLYAQPVKLHPDNPHYFLYKNKPRVFITSAEHYGAVLNLDFDYKKYLQALHDEGMDYTRIFAGSYLENTESFGIEKNTLAPLNNKLITPWVRSKEPGYVNGGNKFDLDRWNEKYFERLHDFISTAEKLDIIVEATFFSSIYNEDNWKYCPFYADNNINNTDRIERIYVHTNRNGNLFKYQEAMVRKIVRELNTYDNVIYEIQNEPWSDQEGQLFLLNKNVIPEKPNWTVKTNQASELSLEWQSDIATIIKNEESNLPKKHLLAQNFCNYGQPIPEIDEHVDIMNFHYVLPEAALWNYGYNRPISFDESGFSQKEESTYRKQAWRFILAGGAVFNNLDYSFVAGYEDGSFEENSSPGLGTKSLRKQFRFLKDFMAELNFIDMQAAKHLIVYVPGFIFEGLADDGKVYAYYFEGKGNCEAKIKVPDGNYKIEWWNPEKGELIKSETLKSKDGLLIANVSFVEEDIALKIMKD